MLDYDAEAGRYDETRGGERRAAAAADAIDQLLPGPGQRVVDVAGGTGIVSAQLAARGHPDVYVSDRSVGMLQVASTRLPGHAVQADATSLPLLAGSMDAVTTIWLLHLLGIEAVGLVVAEVARVLRDGGRFITTVDKDAAYAFARARRARRVSTDAREDIVSLAGREGLALAGETTFVGHGQARMGRSDPVYTMLAFVKGDAAPGQR